MADNLVLRGGTFHVRLAIPADIQAAFGNRKILTQSLGTGLRSEAMPRRLPILAKWKQQFEAVRERKSQDNEQWRERLSDFSKDMNTGMDNFFLQAAKGRRAKPDEGISLESMKDQLSKIARHADPEAFLGFISVLKNMGSQDVSDVEYLNKLSAAGQAMMASIVVDRYSLSDDEAEEAKEILVEPTTYKPKSPITTPKLERFRDHLATQNDNAKTIDQVVSRVRKISSYLSEKGSPLDFDTVHSFINEVSTSSKTRRQYLWSGKKFWTWAVRYDQDFRAQFGSVPCPFEGHELPRNKASQGESWAAFSKQDLERLYKAALEKKDTTLAHLIQVAAFTGCRLEELGRLKIDSAVLKNGVPIAFNVEQAKTKAGVRTVPIHRDLLPLYRSLMEHADAEGYLFEGGNNKYGNRLDACSKRFGRLKTALDFDDSYVFHSIRKTTATLLHQAGADPLMIPAILGHEVGHISFDIYSKGPSLEQKTEAIELLKYNFN
ncbi:MULTISPECIES: tyrosine-type recombinase/integrase [Pseudomonas]|uniref:tyrosine-type recombinase/integrase n=1 Tax=Pseudomonas TaxID=286 RepID=UPI0009230652|nr:MULTISPECIES: tyrosine-type recombinase/integrase [Pseudomonas]SHI35495.1 Phage integrase family protein [Pseudomonas zeshuii]